MIRPAIPQDFPQIDRVNEAAFAQRAEADLIANLRDEGVVILELVEELEGKISGHILFTRMWIVAQDSVMDAVALAPVAVLPEFQRRGVGGKLIRQGLELLKERGERIVIVLGHPEYYPRFGFLATKAQALASPFPGDAFMALDLEPGALEGVRGRVRYARSFGLE